MSSPHRASSQSSDHADNARKRVCKACDRCRLKKSKCDGASPCLRCKADNAICVFGERKKSQDKVYPKGYVEMLEQQQSQLVAGLRELYRRLQEGDNWPGEPLKKNTNGGHPLTHDILERLDLLHSTNDAPIKHEGFEDDLAVLQQRCLETNGIPSKQRKTSLSEESEPGLASDDSSHGIPSPPRAMSFVADPYNKREIPTTPPMHNSPYLDVSQMSPRTKYEPALFSGNLMPTIAQKRGFDAMQLFQTDNWQMPLFDQPMDVDSFTTQYSQPNFDALLYHQYSAQGQDLVWGDMNDYLSDNALGQV
ncbi:hypothetical protein FKW77_003119 [Venturia effusa]|uniref:Zn(2)-C6 fungal-type domain-containing protein n=1 Tax=Venturia effusa TaxID=50376 RepID=A0A517L700_9PEZI|nr:hypothetical protein FKW77_003119 [Venturia effusa]